MTALPRYHWQPTTAVIAARAGLDPRTIIRFDHNTSPFVPPWAEAEAARAAARLNEYPEVDYAELRRSLGAVHGVAPELVVVAAGADELIRLCAQAFAGSGKVALCDFPTYGLHRIASLQQKAQLVEIPREDRGPVFPVGGFPTERFLEASTGADLTWLCQPHNPTGDRLEPEVVAAILDAAGGVVVVDAAYAEFAAENRSDLMKDRDNVVVLGTLSKAYGLAGIRVGYALTSPRLADILETLRPPASVSTISAALALRALADPEWMQENVARIVAGRDHLSAGLNTAGLTPYSSATNFVLCRVGPQAPDVASRLTAAGIVVRPFPAEGPLAEHLRFTVRAPEEQERLFAALEVNLS
jgi:histidinol-phosphate aminotransferase